MPGPKSESAPKLHVKLPAKPAAVVEGRKAVERYLQGSVSRYDLDTARLLVTELVANRVQRAQCSMESDLDLVVQKSNGCLIFEVYDNAPCFTSDLVRDDAQKGLMLVEKLSTRLGYEKAEQCRLWCEIELDDLNASVRQFRL